MTDPDPDPTAPFRDQLKRAISDHRSGSFVAEVVQALEPVIRQIVAGELRWLVDELTFKRTASAGQRYSDGYFDGVNLIRDAMADRAAELDPAAALPAQTADTVDTVDLRRVSFRVPRRAAGRGQGRRAVTP